ncbi:MAG: hypothetical protein ACPLW8_05830, partial [Candidatus Bathyarchaeales archaeon]
MTLKEQWLERVATYTQQYRHEIEVVTYHAYDKVKNNEYSLIVFDECLPYYSKVLLEDGSEMPIGEIVEKRLPVKVLSFNPVTKKIEAKRVINYYKIPLHNSLVKVTHEGGCLICTEDHKIFTANRGYVEAKSLKHGDILLSWKVLSNDLQMQEMRERVPKSHFSGRTLCCCTQPRTSKDEMAEINEEETEFLQRVKREVQMQNWGQKSELERWKLSENVNGCPAELNLWKPSWRLEHFESKRAIQLPYPNSSRVKPSRVYYVEIFNTQRFLFNRAKNSRKQGLWEKVDTFSDLLASNIHGDLQHLLQGWKENNHKGVAEPDELTISSCNMVSGRWQSIQSQDCRSLLLQVSRRAEADVSGLASAEVGIECYNPEGHEQRQFHKIQQGEQQEVFEINRALCPADSQHALQDFVYDIEVEDNHNFFADGVLVSNCQHLPANTFVRLATLKAKYRMGFSGSPYREDGRENYIIALTGFPVGMSWEELIRLQVVREPTFRVYILSDNREKMRKLGELLQIPVKTLIFCDWLDLGEKIAKAFNIPFVYG